MIDELNAAVALISSYLKTLQPDDQINLSGLVEINETFSKVNAEAKRESEDSENCPDDIKCSEDKKYLSENFEECLNEALLGALQAKFKGHWYPELPSKGSGFRCLKFGAQSLDGAIISACESCGIERSKIATSLPNDLILWIDPGEVSYKIGESVPLTTVYSKPPVQTQQLQISPQVNEELESLCNEFPGILLNQSAANDCNNPPASAMLLEHDPNNNTIRSRSAVPFQRQGKKLSTGSTGGASVGSGSQTPNGSEQDIGSSFAKQHNAISPHVLFTANEFSALPSGLNSVGPTRRGVVGPLFSAPNAMDAADFFGVANRPTSLPGVKNAAGNIPPFAHANSNGMPRNVSRNPGFYWKSPNRGQHSGSFTCLNPEAAVFSPSVSPEQQLFPPGMAQLNNSNSPYPNNSGHPQQPLPHPAFSHAPDPNIMSMNLLGFQDDTHLRSGLSNGGGNGSGMNAGVVGNPATSPGTRSNGVASLVSPTQRFYTSNGLAQLQFHQQAFRGGSPVDYGTSALNRPSPMKSNLTSSPVSQSSQQPSAVGNNTGAANNTAVTSVAQPPNSSSSSLTPPFSSGGVSGGNAPLSTLSNQQPRTPPNASVTTSSANNVSTIDPQQQQQQQQRLVGTSGSSGQLMTADAFAATKFGSTKLKSRKSNINLSQMSATQFEAYMRHKTSTMHSRPPHTNYTDAYPSNSFNSPISPPNQHQNVSPGNGSGFYGPISPVGRGSSGSSNSTPSPCGSYPGFPSPSMSEMMSRGVPQGSISDMARGAPQGSVAGRFMGRGPLGNVANFEQFVQDLCNEDNAAFLHQPNNVNSFLNSANFNHGNTGVAGQAPTLSPLQQQQSSTSNVPSSHNSFSHNPDTNSGANVWTSHSTALKYQQHYAGSGSNSAGNPASSAVANAFLPPFHSLASRVGAN